MHTSEREWFNDHQLRADVATLARELVVATRHMRQCERAYRRRLGWFEDCHKSHLYIYCMMQLEQVEDGLSWSGEPIVIEIPPKNYIVPGRIVESNERLFDRIWREKMRRDELLQEEKEKLLQRNKELPDSCNYDYSCVGVVCALVGERLLVGLTVGRFIDDSHLVDVCRRANLDESTVTWDGGCVCYQLIKDEEWHNSSHLGNGLPQPMLELVKEEVHRRLKEAEERVRQP